MLSLPLALTVEFAKHALSQ